MPNPEPPADIAVGWCPQEPPDMVYCICGTYVWPG
jgi:hypothetical protein